MTRGVMSDKNYLLFKNWNRTLLPVTDQTEKELSSHRNFLNVLT